MKPASSHDDDCKPTFVVPTRAIWIPLLLLVLDAVSSGFAQSPFTYTVKNGTVAITGYNAMYTWPPPPVVIPDTINGLPVTDVEGMAFYQNNDISSVVIGNNVTNIGPEAFVECEPLFSVTIGNSVTHVGASAFSSCDNLTNVTLGNSLAWIDEWAFSGCVSLRFVTIPATVTNISQYAFTGCSFLRGIYFEGDMPTLGTDSVPAALYYLPGAAGWTPTYNGYSNIVWNPQIQTGGSNFGVGTNGFGFNITGMSNTWFSVEACTDLANPNWLPIQTNRFASGTFHFIDPQSTNFSARFYRLQMP